MARIKTTTDEPRNPFLDMTPNARRRKLIETARALRQHCTKIEMEATTRVAIQDSTLAEHRQILQDITLMSAPIPQSIA